MANVCIFDNTPVPVSHDAVLRGLRAAEHFSPEALRSAPTPGKLAAMLAKSGESLKSVVVSGGVTGINYLGQDIVPQDLEIVARNWLWKQSMLKLLAKTPMVKARSRQHQWPRIRSYGNIRSALHMPEGGRPTGTSGRADLAQVWLTTQGRLNRVTGMAEAQDTVEVMGSRNPFVSNRRMVLELFQLQRAVNMLFDRTDTTTNPEAWKGIYQQMEEYWADPVLYPDNPLNMPVGKVGPLVDVRGHLTRSHVEAANEHFQNNFGNATDLFIDLNTARAFQGQLESGAFTGGVNVERLNMANPDGDGVVIGAPVRGIGTLSGMLKLTVDKSLEPQYRTAMYGPGGFVASEGAPAQPAAPAVNVPVGAVAASRWAAGDIPGAATIEYRIQAYNERGESLPSNSTGAGAVVVGVNGRVVLTWNGAADATGYRVLRNNPTIYTASGRGLVEFWEVGRVKNVGGVLTFTDYNHSVAGYTEAIMVEFAHPAKQGSKLVYPVDATENTIAMADLAGGMRSVRLPSLGDYSEEMIFYRQHPVLYIPTRIVRFMNIKPYED